MVILKSAGFVATALVLAVLGGTLTWSAWNAWDPLPPNGPSLLDVDRFYDGGVGVVGLLMVITAVRLGSRALRPIRTST